MKSLPVPAGPPGEPRQLSMALDATTLHDLHWEEPAFCEVPSNRSVEIRRELASFLDFVAGNAGMVPNVAEPSAGVFLGRNSYCAGRGIIHRFAL